MDIELDEAGQVVATTTSAVAVTGGYLVSDGKFFKLVDAEGNVRDVPFDSVLGPPLQRAGRVGAVVRFTIKDSTKGYQP